MANIDNKNNHDINEAKIAAFLKDTISKVEHSSNADIDNLKKITKLFKKNVPLSRRSYVISYLVRGASGSFSRADQGVREAFRGQRDNDRNRAKRQPEQKKASPRAEQAAQSAKREEPEPPRVMPDPSLTKSVFIGVGRQRKAFPKDILKLLTEVAKVDIDHIGRVKVLSSYTFADILTEDCPKAIEALNGYEYRGQSLTVDYAKQKPKDAAPSGQSPVEPAENADAPKES